jgi:hypothetical protein
VLSNPLDTIGTDDGSTTVGLDITPQRNDKQSLLRTIQVVLEEIPIIMPIVPITPV